MGVGGVGGRVGRGGIGVGRKEDGGTGWVGGGRVRLGTAMEGKGGRDGAMKWAAVFFMGLLLVFSWIVGFYVGRSLELVGCGNAWEHRV